jgi:hypothetical protein
MIYKATLADDSTRVALLFPSNDVHAVTAHLSMYAELQSAGGEGQKYPFSP